VGGSEPLYVLGKDAGSNRVVVGPRDQLETSRVRIRGARLHRDAARVNSVRFRYHAPVRPCSVELDSAGGNGEREATVLLAEPVDGVAPGQLACLLDDDLIVGHGTIALDL
jgi:tRNA-specific 2-thiouridylase